MEVFYGITESTGDKISADQTSSGTQITCARIDTVILEITLANTCSEGKVIDTRETKTGAGTVITGRIGGCAA